MYLTFRHLRLVAWIAIGAMLLGALAPTLSRALAAERSGDGWVEVCSSDGMIRVLADGAFDSDPDEKGSDGRHADGACCPYCVAHAGSFGLEPGMHQHSFVATLMPGHVKVAFSSLRSTPPSGNHPPRAPPVLI